MRDHEERATPRPWMYRKNPGSQKDDWPFHIDQQGTPGRTDWGILIAACWGHTTESSEANARLIVSAVNAQSTFAGVVEAAREAWAHLDELRSAWMSGAISDHDGKGGQRSNRNVDVEVKLRYALEAYEAAKGTGA